MKQRCSQKLSKEVRGRINCTLHFDDLQKVGSLTEHILHHETHMSVVCTLHTQQTCEIMSGTLTCLLDRIEIKFLTNISSPKTHHQYNSTQSY
jgi:hypothetical protein